MTEHTLRSLTISLVSWLWLSTHTLICVYEWTTIIISCVKQYTAPSGFFCALISFCPSVPCPSCLHTWFHTNQCQCLILVFECDFVSIAVQSPFLFVSERESVPSTGHTHNTQAFTAVSQLTELIHYGPCN